MHLLLALLLLLLGFILASFRPSSGHRHKSVSHGRSRSVAHCSVIIVLGFRRSVTSDFYKR